MRVTHEQQWRPSNLIQPVRSMLLALLFEWGIALQGLHSTRQAASNAAERSTRGRMLVAKITRQAAKDYLFFPALSLRRWRRTLAANAVANLIRNVWAYLVICCGHFAEGAHTFTAAVLDSETKAEWYLRQLLGTANFHAGPVMAFMSGNLSYQIEHHLFPDLPSNRYAEISDRVQAVCARYGLPYTTGRWCASIWASWPRCAGWLCPAGRAVDDRRGTRHRGRVRRRRLRRVAFEKLRPRGPGGCRGAVTS